MAGKREGVPCLPYARELIRLGLRTAGERLDRIDPLLCQQLLAERLEDADWGSRFLTGSWQTLVSRTWPLLTERVVRTFGGSDFRPADLLGPEPVSVYLRLTERDMRGLRPLLRLVWETLLNELVAHYDRVAGAGCHPVLLMLDEAARFAVPSLPDYAATVAGRGRSLWVAIPVAQPARRRLRSGRRPGAPGLAGLAALLPAERAGHRRVPRTAPRAGLGLLPFVLADK